MKTRIIGVVNILNGVAVQSIQFNRFLPIGDPKIAIEYLFSWGIDEIIILDISREKKMFKKFPYFIKNCFVPVTIGGGINNMKDVDYLIKSGADKVAINTQAINDPKLLESVSKKYGNQALIVSIDVKKIKNKYTVFTNSGMVESKISLKEIINIAENSGAGEILINSIDSDGTKKGFDKRLFIFTKNCTNLPLNICGGAGKISHFEEIINLGPSGICAANFFHFKEQRVRFLKDYLVSLKKNIRISN